MKFYFCETCGKRLTEHDIEGGVARDKKLKGVFCKECAVGVTTMDSLPLTDGEAREVVASASPQPETKPTAERAGRRSSAVGLPPARRGGDPSAESARERHGSRTAAPSYLKVVFLGVVAAMIVVGGLVALSGREPVPADKQKETREPRKLARPDESDAERPVPTGVPEAGPAKDDPKRVAIREEPAPKEAPPSRKPVREPNEAQRQVSSPPKPRTVAQPEKGTIDPKPTPPSTDPVPDARKSDEVNAAAKAKFAGSLKAFDEAVSSGDLVAAREVVKQAKLDPSLKAVTEEVASLARLEQALSAADASRKRALAGLADGEKRTFHTAKGSVTGVVRKIEGETLRVQVEGRINKQVIVYEKRVKLSDLTAACRAKLLGDDLPETPDAWLARAVRKIAERDLAQSEVSLAKVGAHPLAAHYRSRLAELRAAEQEAAARREWEARLLPLTKKAKFTKTGARAGKKALAAFRTAYGKTAFAGSVAEQTKALEALFQIALGPPRKLTIDLGDDVRMDFVLIPAGAFTRGATKEKKGHTVTLTKAFYLGKYEVTQAQYERLMGKNPSKHRGADRPVERVPWDASQAFCRKLSEKTKKKARLPTEAEWEYACRAGTKTRFSFGDSDAELSAHGWFKGNSETRTHRVGRKEPNKWGLYDMHGNVWEWCQDWFGGYSAGPVTDPQGPATGSDRVIRGGSVLYPAIRCTSSFRGFDTPGIYRFWNIGFRPALEP